MFNALHIPYAQTGLLSRLMTDYINGEDALRPFYAHRPNAEGIKSAIEIRKKYPNARKPLHDLLTKQYAGMSNSEKVNENIDLLLNENTFTVCTAHQPNIFTGRLYFIYKIIHAVKTAAYLNREMPQYHFIPVYYMGSEDADIKELGEICINGEKLHWKTPQRGAVGRMKVDDGLLDLIERISNELYTEAYGETLIELLKSCYSKGKSIEAATFEFIHHIFGSYGLLIVLPDNRQAKLLMGEIFKKELTESFSNHILEDTIAQFPSEYSIQAKGRDVNLFYLKGDIRERILKTEDGYSVHQTAISFTEHEMMNELNEFPERFSPNVVLRPLMQEILLPNVAFIGGGGELSYWLELKKIFETAAVPFPLLLLRNSFLFIDKKHTQLLDDLGLQSVDFLHSTDVIQKKFVTGKKVHDDDLSKEKNAIIQAYESIQSFATVADITLERHVQSLSTNALKRIEQLEKKMFRARKKTFEAEMRKIEKIKRRLFPDNSLQERVEIFLPYYAAYGNLFLEQLFEASGIFEQQFCIISER